REDEHEPASHVRLPDWTDDREIYCEEGRPESSPMRPLSPGYRKMWKFPSSHQSKRKMTMVEMQPPPSFLAPQPAARPRRILLMSTPWCGRPARETNAAG